MISKETGSPARQSYMIILENRRRNNDHQSEFKRIQEEEIKNSITILMEE